MKSLHPVSYDILTYLSQFNSSYTATLDEIASIVDKSTVTVYWHVTVLVGMGLVSKQPRRARTIRITEEGRVALKAQETER